MEATTITSLIRQVLTFAGGYAVARGYVDQSSMNEIIGGAAAVASIVWSITHHVTANNPNRPTIP